MVLCDLSELVSDAHQELYFSFMLGADVAWESLAAVLAVGFEVLFAVDVLHKPRLAVTFPLAPSSKRAVASNHRLQLTIPFG